MVRAEGGSGRAACLLLAALAALAAAGLFADSGPGPAFRTAPPGACPSPGGEDHTVNLIVVYDNNPYDERLRTAWGFACLVTHGDSTVLFDTGGDGTLLLANMRALGLDPLQIDAVVLSHIHSDHTGGLSALLAAGARPVVYVPAAFPRSFKNDVRRVTRLVEVTRAQEILPGIHSSGEVNGGIVEQALAVESAAGLVVVTGCAHPGVVEMVRRCKQSLPGEVAWVIGGFHLGGASEPRIRGIIDELRRLGVQRYAPCHCTGDKARQMFAESFGPAYSPAGAGWTLSLPAP
ncbi:MAG: MBL fold metallo-hydrolase [Spirochaetales bacterium]|nr:MBL fold metallo-hydrolase [Spirochaetales bacterium]